MAKKNEIQIIISAVDKASKEIGGIDNALGKLGKAAAIGGAAVAAAGTAIGIAAFNLAKDAAPIEGIKNAFDGLTESFEGGSKKMLEALKESSYGMVKNSDLMMSFNQAAQLVSKDFAQQLPDAMKYLSKVSAATGQDMSFMMDSLVKGVGRMSPMILDNLGIQVDLAMATERAAEMFGKQADQLSKAELQAGLMNVVMEKLQQNTADMPEVTNNAATSFAQLQTKMANLKEEIGLKLLPLFSTIANKLMELWDRPETQAAVDRLMTWIGNVIGDEDSGLIGVITTLTDGGVSALIKEAFGFEGNDKLSDMIDKVLKLDSGTTEENMTEIKGIWERYFGVDGEYIRIVSGFVDELTQLGEIAQAAQQGQWEKVGRLIYDAIYGWTGKVTTRFENWLTELIEKIKKMDWSNAGAGIVTKIGEGIVSKFQWFIDNVVNPFLEIMNRIQSGYSSQGGGGVPYNPIPGYQHGGSFIVPGSGSGDRPYTLGLEPGERVTVTPRNRAGGALNLTVNINTPVNLADRSYAERELMPYIESGVRQILARAT